jgi:hypothetical protein
MAPAGALQRAIQAASPIGNRRKPAPRDNEGKMKKLAIAAAIPVFALAASAFTLAPNASASSACHSSSG